MNRVIVAGSIITDMSVVVEKHPSVGETVVGNNLSYSPGGKGANQAVSAVRLGSKVAMVGKIGNDVNGEMSYNFLRKEGIDCYDLTKANKSSTGIAMIVVSEKTGNNNIVVVPGANDSLSPGNIDSLYDDLDSFGVDESDILVSQFETPLETTKHFFQRGKEIGTINILNPAPARKIPEDIINLIDVLIVNESELGIITNDDESITEEMIEDWDVVGELEENLIWMINNINNRPNIVIVTLGKNGVFAMIGDESIKIDPIRVKAIDTTGAGDCFVGGIAAFMSVRPIKNIKVLEEALRFANHAASISVQRKGSGVSMPYNLELGLPVMRSC